jgi:hypothetical protein
MLISFKMIITKLDEGNKFRTPDQAFRRKLPEALDLHFSVRH